MFSIHCPECGKEFTVRYMGDRVYCHCQLPVRLVFVPPYDDKEVQQRMVAKVAEVAGRED